MRPFAELLRTCVNWRLCEILWEQLRYAVVEGVLDLCMQRLAHTELSKEVLESRETEIPGDPGKRKNWCENECERIAQQTGASRYVQDCERIAQYNQILRRLSNVDLEKERMWADEQLQKIVEEHRQLADERLQKIAEDPRQSESLQEQKIAANDFLTQKQRRAVLRDAMALCRHLGRDTEAIELVRVEVKKLPRQLQEQAKWVSTTAKKIGRRLSDIGHKEDGRKVIRYIEDVEVAEEIRKRYFGEYAYWMEKTVLARLIQRFGGDVGRAKTDCPLILSELEQKVCSRETFRKCAGQYEPAKGREFEHFFKWLALQRLKDILRRYNSPKDIRFNVDEDPIPAGPLDPLGRADGEQAKRSRDALQTCMESLEEQKHKRVPDYGLQLCAVYVLHYKASIDPDLTPPNTRSWLKSQCGSHCMNQFQEEYRESGRRLRELEHETLAKLRSDRTITLRQCEQTQCTLEEQHHSTVDVIDRLREEARRRRKGDLQSELKQLGNSASDQCRRHELEFAISYRDYRDKVNKIENEEEKLRKIDDPDSDRAGLWIRSQQEIARLTQLTQSVVSRRLNGIAGEDPKDPDDPQRVRGAKELMRRCLEEKVVLV